MEHQGAITVIVVLAAGGLILLLVSIGLVMSSRSHRRRPRLPNARYAIGGPPVASSVRDESASALDELSHEQRD